MHDIHLDDHAARVTSLAYIGLGLLGRLIDMQQHHAATPCSNTMQQK